MTAISTSVLLYPGWPYAAAGVVTFLAWLVWRAVSRPRPFRWSDHRSALAEFNRTGGRR